MYEHGCTVKRNPWSHFSCGQYKSKLVSIGGASRPPMGNSASLNSSVLRLIFGNKQTMLNAKTIGFLLIIMSNHDLHPYHEEIGR